MTDLRLISHHLCPYVQRAVIVLTEKNIAHERDYIDLADKPDWLKDLSPLGRVPLLLTGGKAVFESQVIAEYLDEITPGSLHPAAPLQRARHRSWIAFGSETLSAIGAFYAAPSEGKFDAAREALRAKLTRIEREIAGPFFGGETFHMVDGVWGTIFRYFDIFDRIADFGLTSDLSAIATWRMALAARPSVAHAAPEGYPDRLWRFLQDRGSHLTGRMAAVA